jgi:hypothetical protein
MEEPLTKGINQVKLPDLRVLAQFHNNSFVDAIPRGRPNDGTHWGVPLRFPALKSD